MAFTTDIDSILYHFIYRGDTVVLVRTELL